MAAIGTNLTTQQLDSNGLPPQKLGDSLRCIADVKKITDIRDYNLPRCLDLLPIDDNQKKPLRAVIKETKTAFGLFEDLLRKLESQKDDLVIVNDELLRKFKMQRNDLDKVKSEAFNEKKPYYLRAIALIQLEPRTRDKEADLYLITLKVHLINRLDNFKINLVGEILRHMRPAGNPRPAVRGSSAQLSDAIVRIDAEIKELVDEHSKVAPEGKKLTLDLKFNALDLMIAKLLMFSLLKEQQDLENPDFNDDVETLEEYINELKEIAKHRTKLEALLIRQQSPSCKIEPELDTMKEKIKILEIRLTKTASRFKEIRRRHVLRSATFDANSLFKARAIERQFSENPRLKNPTCKEKQLLDSVITSDSLFEMLTENFKSLFDEKEKKLLSDYISEVVQSFESKVDKATTESSAIDT